MTTRYEAVITAKISGLESRGRAVEVTEIVGKFCAEKCDELGESVLMFDVVAYDPEEDEERDKGSPYTVIATSSPQGWGISLQTPTGEELGVTIVVDRGDVEPTARSLISLIQDIRPDSFSLNVVFEGE